MAEPKVEVVISGIGGLFPEADNLDELKTLLFDKVNAVTSDCRRWTPGLLETPDGVGKIRNPHKFDNIFFGIHRKMAESLDVLTRLSLERSIEAIVDAGLNPVDLSGTNTGVFMNSCVSESEFFEVFDTNQKGFGLLGHNRAMQANRLSYILNLNGPSYTTDATWIGGIQALMRAKQLIEDGEINAAIIGSCNVCLNPNISLQFEGLGRLTNTNETRSYSADASGMNRGESCIAVFLQKSTEAKRSYGTVLNATAIFGETHNLLYHYSEKLYKEVLVNAYKNAGVDPSKVAYVEGEGSGIKKIDVMELNTLSDVFCTPNRRDTLKIGSIKSNVGHCEATSSLVSLVKALIVSDSGYIPPNINYSEPNPDCPGLFSGKLEVVTEKTPLNGDIIGISSFGLCNSFGHVILKQNEKFKTKTYEKGEMFDDGLPRLIFVSARNEDGVQQFIGKIKDKPIDEEFAALLQSVFYKSMNAHYYRSFCIVPDITGENTKEDVSYLPALTKRPIWFIFSGMGSQWNGMGKQLLNIPIFAESIRKCEAVLKPKGVDLMNILTSEDPKLFDNILNSFVGIAAIQIGLVDILKSIDVLPDGIVGHSVGELGCAYADGCFTAEQMILAAHARGRASIETKLIDGMMAAIGLGYNDIKDRLPDDIEVACHNASDSSTLSGPTASVTSFVEQLKSEGVFAKIVNVSNIAYHSKYIKPAAPTLLKYLREVILESKPRSSKWISSSIPESEWGNELSQKSSPEYHTNNLLGQVLFEEASRHIPENAIAIEIAPHGLLQAILKRSLPNTVTNIPLTLKSSKNSVKFLLSAIGKMYINGVSPNIEAFYPSINYPVSRGTQSLSSLLPWDHTENWTLKSMVQGNARVSGERRFSIYLNNENILSDFKISGCHVLPSSIILLHVWKSFLIIKNELHFDDIVGFEDITFLKNIEIAPNETLEFYSLIQCGSGRFEVCLDNEVILSGRIFRPDALDMVSINPKLKYPSTIPDFPYSSISKHDLYALLKHKGYELGEKFQIVTNIDLHFQEYRGNVKWNNDWMSFLYGIFTFLIHKNVENNDSPVDITTIRQIIIDPSKFKNHIGKDVPIHYNFKTNDIQGDGIYISHPILKPLTISLLNGLEVRLEEERFIQLDNTNFESEIIFINNCVQIIFEFKKYHFNSKKNNINIYCNSDEQIMSQYITLVKKMLDLQLGVQHQTLSLSSINSENLINKEHNIILVSKGQMQSTIQTFKNIKKVYILVLSDELLLSGKDWNVIMQQKFNGLYLVLIKKIKEKKTLSVHVKNIMDLQNVYSDIENYLAECKRTKSYLYIFTKNVPYVKLTSFIEEVLLKNKSKMIRFVFFLDKSIPDMNLTYKFYAEQLCKHLFVNIFKDGKWGTISRNIVDNSNFNIILDNNSTTHINSIMLDDLQVKYLGINFQDITVNNVTDSELGHLEYSGVTVDGKMIMGIAPFEKNTSKRISPDPYLSWIIPSDWSLEDAATVPLSYSLAYYVMTVLITPSDKFNENTILVHAGFNAVGQAAIAIALNKGFTVYATVENEEQAGLLKKKFPELPSSRIFSYKNISFEVQLKMATKGEGISIILNCLSGNEFQASLKTLSNFGKFFQLTKADMKKKTKFGMVFFLKASVFYAISPDGLLSVGSDMKVKLQNEVQKGIELGIVKPFNRHVLTGPCTGEQAIKALRLSSQGIETKRVVLALEGEKTLRKSLKDSGYEKYQCYSNRVYFIVGSKYNTWIDLAEWLVIRGARKIVVAIKKYGMSTTVSRRFNLLMTRYQNIMIQIVSDSNLNSKGDIIQLMKTTTVAAPLGGVFIATLMSDDNDKIRNIQYALENLPPFGDIKPLFVCIMSDGDEVCAELRTSGVCPNAISISWSSMATTEMKFSCLVSSLDKLLINFERISCSKIVCTEYNKELNVNKEVYSKIVAELPSSIDELITFGDTVTEEPEFVEVFTSSPRFVHSVGSIPVFAITGFRPERMKKLYEKLMYPTFEARLPETIDSIESVAITLVQKLKIITKYSTVSLIGVSWGGAVCLLMAQLLEAENIAVSVTLLEGVPALIQEWASSLIQYGNVNAKLLSNYFKIDSVVAKELSTKNGWSTELYKVLSSNNVAATDKTSKALKAICSRLNALFTIKPFPNRILAKVKVMTRSIHFEKLNPQNCSDYCVNLPSIFTIDEHDYDIMLSLHDVAQAINSNVLHCHPDSDDISVTEFYARCDRDTVGSIVLE